jgi:hypothetical protein
MRIFQCRICEWEWDEIPSDAVRVGRGRGTYVMYRFADGQIHDIRMMQVGPRVNPEAVNGADAEEK